MKRLGIALFLLAACAADRAQPRSPAPGPPAQRAGLPGGFEVAGKPSVHAAFLEPRAAWRALRSRLTTLQAEAVSRGKDILVTFEPHAVHATTRAGERETWRMPAGLVFAGCPAHLLLSADYTLRLYRADHSQVQLGEGVTIVTARILDKGRNVEEIRLVIKGERGIRSISNAG